MMKYFNALLITLFFINSAGAEELSYKNFLTQNQKNIESVAIGMSEKQVVAIMGSDTTKVKNGPLDNPWKIERTKNSAIYHYLTHKNPPFTPILENQATPVMFKNGKVTAIGRGYIKEFRESANPTAAPAASSQKSIEERLKTLDGLLKSGAIDKATYEAKKKQILDEI